MMRIRMFYQGQCISRGRPAIEIQKLQADHGDSSGGAPGPIYQASSIAPKSLRFIKTLSAQGRRPLKLLCQPQVAELTVSAASDPSVVSGALAARVREARPVCLTAIGIEAVAKSIRSICHARLYLEVGRI